MGANLYAAIEDESFNANESDRVFVCKHQEELDAVAASLGVKPLSSFFSYSQEEIADQGMEAPEGLEAQWFSPDEVSKTLSAFIGKLEASPEVKDAGRLLEELQDLLQVAVETKQKSTQLRFFVGL